jgi:outer membrane protein OmpA-like peptidoglycan-associated protein
MRLQLRYFHTYTLTGIILVLLFLSASTCQAAADVKGSHDYPLVSRIPGSVIMKYKHLEYDAFPVGLGPARDNKVLSKNVEGEMTGIVYKIPDDKSVLQVFRSYERAFKKAGVTRLFSCSNNECGPNFPVALLQNVNDIAHYNYLGIYNMSRNSDYRFYSGEVNSGNHTVYISMFVSTFKLAKSPVYVALDFAEAQAFVAENIVIDLSSLEDSIKNQGKAVLQGIYFDYDKATLKPESSKAIGVITDFLKKNPQTETYIVGHTDNQGSYEYNLKLSQDRAEAVRGELVSHHGIPPAQVQPVGIGPVAPVTSNKDEEGRAQNRRVELVIKK